MHTSPGPVPHRPCVVIETQGCKLNLADSDLLAGEFLKAGYRLAAAGQPADVYVLNTCTVTHVADAKARHKLHTARTRHPGALVVAAGCYPARDASAFDGGGGVDLAVGNAEKPVLVRMVGERLRTAARWPAGGDDPDVWREPFPFHRTRAFIKVQEGCNDHCAYCIIPKTRGASRWFSPRAIVAAIQERAAAGHQEVVLTGTQLGDYGIDTPGARTYGADPRDQASEGDPLAALLEQVLAETAVPRIRLSSLQPQDVTPRLLSLWADPRLCPHFHLPLQSGAGTVLRAMRRRYTSGQFLAAVEGIRTAVPHASITSDLIVGFPGESDADYEQSLEVCRAAGFAAIHVFPYSSRPRTLAERMAKDPDIAVSEATKQARLKEALVVGASLREAWLGRCVGQQRPVLWEEQRTGGDGVQRWHGLTDTYLNAAACGPELQRGQVSTVKFTKVQNGVLVGSVVTTP